jgi:hypothetical protein
MADVNSCQRPGCDCRGEDREITNPANGRKVKLRLCDDDYKDARSDKPPLWLSELLKHIGLVG